MNQTRFRRFVRQFPENGILFLLEEPGNVRDLLSIVAHRIAPCIDFNRLQRRPHRFVLKSFRKRESDLVFEVPFRTKGERRRRPITIYILIEHQSQPDLLMGFRLLLYMMLIWDTQRAEWEKSHGSYAGFRLRPILPLVFYTGSQKWESIGDLVSITELGEKFEDFIPRYSPLFLNLGATPTAQVIKRGGWLGWLLWVMQHRAAKLEEFQAVVREAVQQLEGMPFEEKGRWLDLISYLEALIFHYRNPKEASKLQRVIEDSIGDVQFHEEVKSMGKTAAQALEERGMKKGLMRGFRRGEIRSKQKTLIRLLQLKFGKVPGNIVEKVESAEDSHRLDQWLDAFATARALEDVGIE